MSRIARLLLPLIPLALASQSCALLSGLFQRPTVSLQRVDVTSLSFTGIGANFVMKVDNPNAIGIDLARLGYQLTIEGKQLAAGQGNQAANIPANGSGLVTLPVAINFSDFVQSVEALLRKDNVNYSIAMSPGFNTPIGIIDIPLSHSGQFPTPKLPDVSLGSAAVGNVSFSGATFSLPINIRNKNGFALPINGLNYRVAIAGTQLIDAGANPGNVPANQLVNVPITAHIDFLRAGIGVVNAIRGGAADVSLNGVLDLGGYKMPLNLATRLGK
jgi:LEA14-like dessication related protein